MLSHYGNVMNILRQMKLYCRGRWGCWWLEASYTELF